MRGDEMKRRLNRVKTRTGQRDLRRDGVLNQDTKRTSASLLANPQRAFQQNPSEPSASLPASRTETNRDDPGGAEREAGRTSQDESRTRDESDGENGT